MPRGNAIFMGIILCILWRNARINTQFTKSSGLSNRSKGESVFAHCFIAVASISIKNAGSINPFISIMDVHGLIDLKNSPWARP